MNIFVTDKCPIKSAQNLDSKRVIKMILESAQMLSNVGHYLIGKGPHKKTHLNHPCSIWARIHPEHFGWLKIHFMALCNEYSFRYPGKVHKCQSLIKNFTELHKEFYSRPMFLDPLYGRPDNIQFQNSATNFKQESDVVIAYRKEMMYKWKNDKRIPVWHQRGKPTWYETYVSGDL